jgi:hypothetical protein
MRSFQVFAAMTPEQATGMLTSLKEEVPGMFTQAVVAAAAAFKARPVYVARQPIEKQAASIRRALSRVSASTFAEELLAVYFIECKKELLIEWLDSIGIEHEDGTLTEDEPKQPAKAALGKAVKAFLAVDDDPNRDLLLAAFAAQNSIDWPQLEALTAKDV